MSTSKVDKAFQDVPNHKPYFMIWRVEAMSLVQVPRENWGSFYTGDSYIILSVKETKSRSLDPHIHFWLGKETTHDEATIAAFKSVELDEYLDGWPVQHREVQEKESQAFLELFQETGGVRYLQGGVDSGLNHVENKVRKRLLHLKGRKNVRLAEVPMSWSSINSGDVFIVDLGQTVFIWQGKNSNGMERIRAAQVAREIADENTNLLDHKVPVVVVEDENERAMSVPEKTLWNEHLPLADKRVLSAEEAGSDDCDLNSDIAITLYCCSDESGSYKVSEVKKGSVLQSDLQSDDVYIIDTGPKGIWVWVGKQATKKERIESMKNAMAFARDHGYMAQVPIERVIDGGEPAAFKALFTNWKNKDAAIGYGRRFSLNRLASQNFDVSLMHKRVNKEYSIPSGMQLDDGNGALKVWRVRGDCLVPVPNANFGTFYSSECYLILYTESRGLHSILYIWQGVGSTKEEKLKACKHGNRLQREEKQGESCTQVIVKQNKESPHFMNIFKGKLLLFCGRKAGWAECVADSGGVYLLQIRSTNECSCRALQVETRAASLNSNDCFALVSSTHGYVWCGKGSNRVERDFATEVACNAKKECSIVEEGQESDDFWQLIGGKEDYASKGRLASVTDSTDARLFHCSDASGIFEVREVPEFSQEDLEKEDVMLLDAGDEVYLWAGAKSGHKEAELALKVAKEYIQTDPNERDSATPITRVRQGFEPPAFTGHFGTWNRNLWSSGKTYQELVAEQGPKLRKSSGNNNTSCEDDIEASFLEKIQMSYSAFFSLSPVRQQQLRKLHMT